MKMRLALSFEMSVPINQTAPPHIPKECGLKFITKRNVNIA